MTRQEAQQRLNIEADLIPRGMSNRPGTAITPTHITIHNTANTAPGADARMHARYVKGPDARARQVSWHYTVDDQRCIKHLPTSEKGFHAKSGNSKSIGIEVCEHQGINKAAAIDRAALLTAVLMAALGIAPDHIVPHQFWTGKDCPHLILREPGGFAAFRAKAAQFLEELGAEAVGGPGVASFIEEFAAGSAPADVASAGDEMGAEARVAALERLVGQLMVENQQLKELTRGMREDEQEAMCANPPVAPRTPGVASTRGGPAAGRPAEVAEPSVEKLRDALDSIGSSEQVRMKIEERDLGGEVPPPAATAPDAPPPPIRKLPRPRRAREKDAPERS